MFVMKHHLLGKKLHQNVMASNNSHGIISAYFVGQEFGQDLSECSLLHVTLTKVTPWCSAGTNGSV